MNKENLFGKIIPTSSLDKNSPGENRLMILSEDEAKQENKEPSRPAKIINVNL